MERTDMARRGRELDDGFTLIEALAAMTLFGVLSAIAVTGYHGYQQAHEEQGSADRVVAVLRNAQERASSESRTYCVRFNSDNLSWTVWRTTCGSGSRVETGTTESPRVTLPSTSRSFVDRAGATSATDVYFYRSGMASAGTLTVIRPGSSKAYTVRVEGLTGRVTST
jgi:prepilin-type N-terminal cleavage/methylation domain-containing protein